MPDKKYHLKHPALKSAKALYECALMYRDYLVANPMPYPVETVNDDDETVIGKKPRMWTLHGMCFHMGFSYQTWILLKKKSDLYAETVAKIECLRYDYNMQYAASGVLRESTLHKDLGLTNKQEITGQRHLDGSADPIKIETEEEAGAKHLIDKLSGKV